MRLISFSMQAGGKINTAGFICRKPDNNYLTLESISREKRETKYIYIIHMQDKRSAEK